MLTEITVSEQTILYMEENTYIVYMYIVPTSQRLSSWFLHLEITMENVSPHVDVQLVGFAVVMD